MVTLSVSRTAVMSSDGEWRGGPMVRDTRRGWFLVMADHVTHFSGETLMRVMGLGSPCLSLWSWCTAPVSRSVTASSFLTRPTELGWV